MRVLETVYKFRGYIFTFTPIGKKKMAGRVYIKWRIVIEWRNKKYFTDYMAFTPSAHICRVVKKSKIFLHNQLKK